MKTSTKLLLGLSVTALVGTTLAVVVSDKVIKTVKETQNRYKVKKFVNDKLDGSEKLLGIVDDLSDSEIESVVGILSKVKDSRNKISVTGKNVREVTEDVKKHLVDFVESFA
ncbi:hypothetical protein [uncultured Vagococcus sp.]|uniref:hypothetical protein n=1 Tax=uncultured Vagococcus sp. TaxID=189676 RepID=UPI0028D21826|nr:hypothetical protein [uncultured Vagococcus sp.]